MTSYSIAEIEELLRYATPEQREKLDRLLTIDRKQRIWRPLPGPQMLAYNCTADVLGYGGAAGGGKTDLAIGKALTQFSKTAIFRREGTELTAVEDRLREIIGNDAGYNGTRRIWRNPVPRVKQIEFGSIPNLGDETKYQGRPRELLALEEAANMLLAQVRFLMGWVRTTTPGQMTQTLMTFNPPTSAEGRWVVDYYAPWLDDSHPIPAMPGELRYFAVVNGLDLEVPDARKFVMKAGEMLYEFDPKAFRVEEIVTPQSRTFIPSRVSDNPYLAGTGYMAVLQALPEPVRSQMLYGDFKAGMSDDPWQVIPTEWVKIAMERWQSKDRKPRMDGMGVDVARGGKDNTIIARRHDMWFDEPLAYPGTQTPDGPTVAGLVVAALRDRAPIHIDVVGVGASPYDYLNDMNLQVIAINAGAGTDAVDKSGLLKFSNLKSFLWWQMREALDPASNTGIALPPVKELRDELCLPKWELKGREISVWTREKMIKELGRSADYASAYINALMDTPRVLDLPGSRDKSTRGHDPYAYRQRTHDPYKRR